MAKFNCNFISYTLCRAVDITVVIPSVTIPEAMGPGICGHKKKEPYPVLYLLHGYGNNHATWGGYSRVELFAEERNIAVVMASGENSFYLNAENGGKMYTFFEKELPEFVQAMFPVSQKPQDTYMAGLSMGGFGTAIVGMAHPERYAALGMFSAAIDLPERLGVMFGQPKASPLPRQIAKRLREERIKLPKTYIAIGEKDFMYGENVAFKDDLIGMGQDVTWVTDPGYGHEWRFWDIQIERFLDWLPRTDAYAVKGRRQA